MSKKLTQLWGDEFDFLEINELLRNRERVAHIRELRGATKERLESILKQWEMYFWSQLTKEELKREYPQLNQLVKERLARTKEAIQLLRRS